MNILTINCQRGYKREALCSFINEQIENKTHDFFLLQELDYQTYSQLDLSSYTIHTLTPLKDGASTVAILWKKGVEPEQKHSLSAYTQENNGYTFGFAGIELRHNDNNLVIGSLHMPAHFSWIKRQQFLKKILDTYNTDKQFIIGGDWNTCLPFENTLNTQLVKPHKLCIPSKASYSLKDIEPGLFWNNVAKHILSRLWPFPLYIDYFTHHHDLEAVAETHTDVHVSDHFPVSLTLSSHE